MVNGILRVIVGICNLLWIKVLKDGPSSMWGLNPGSSEAPNGRAGWFNRTATARLARPHRFGQSLMKAATPR